MKIGKLFYPFNINELDLDESMFIWASITFHLEEPTHICI